MNYEKHKITFKKKSKIEKIKSNPSEVAKLAAPKVVQVLYNAIIIGPRLILRSAFYLLRANIVTRVLSAVVLVIFDTYFLIRRHISIRQYFINVAMALALLIGSTAGWYWGGDITALVIDNVIIGFIGSLIGAGLVGFGLGAVVERLMTRFIKDDTKAMLEICNETFCELAAEYGLDDEQASEVVKAIEVDGKVVREMYASPDKKAFACGLIEHHMKEITHAHHPELT